MQEASGNTNTPMETEPIDAEVQVQSGSQSRSSRSVACQTDDLEPDEATLRNELAMGAFLQILGVLDDDRQPVYHDLGEAYANKVFLQAMADPATMEEEEDEEEAETEAEEETDANGKAAVAATAEAAAGEANMGPGVVLQRLQSLESQVIAAEWSLRCKLAQVRESAKHPVQRWLEGALPASASPFASRAASVRSGPLHSAATPHSRPSSVAGLSEVFVSDSDDADSADEDESSMSAAATTPTAAACASKSEMTFYSCTVHGVEVPESFVRVKLRGGEADDD